MKPLDLDSALKRLAVLPPVFYYIAGTILLFITFVFAALCIPKRILDAHDKSTPPPGPPARNPTRPRV